MSAFANIQFICGIIHIDVSEATIVLPQQMEQADDTLSDISDFIKTLIKGKKDVLSVKGTNSLLKLMVQRL